MIGTLPLFVISVIKSSANRLNSYAENVHQDSRYQLNDVEYHAISSGVTFAVPIFICL